jgi:mono/diheme cytochrome c family protein
MENNYMHALIALTVVVASTQMCLAAPAGNSENGKALAVRWCASCHIVSPQQASGTTEAPPFATIAKEPEDELEKLELFLAALHYPMPPLSLSRTEIRDLVAYITSLKIPE